jgi:hypothetical protein
MTGFNEQDGRRSKLNVNDLNMHHSECGGRMAYIFRSKVGTFSIREDEANAGTFELSLGGIWLCNCETPQGAAAMVCRQETGWFDWDRLTDPEKPADLKDWECLE